jgi:hypothetical protein
MGRAYPIDNSNSNSNDLLLGRVSGGACLEWLWVFLVWKAFSRLIRTDTLILFVELKCISNEMIE